AKSGTATLFAIFGGQGNVEDYFSDLVHVSTVYSSLVRPFIAQAAVTLARHSASPEAQKEHATLIDVMGWLENKEGKERPSNGKLLEPHLSLPLIGLTQLVNYLVVCKVLGVGVGEFRECFVGTTGHSQGIVSSIVISSSTTEKQFYENTQKALALLFWIGLRSQRACPPTSIDPTVLQDSLENGEGVPTPMLAVTGLHHTVLLDHANTTNSFLPPTHHIHLSLLNGPRTTIFTGPPQSLYAFNVLLRKLKAPAGVDQSRTPHSMRKVKVTSRFLPVAVPFHSGYLEGVVEAVKLDCGKWGVGFESEGLGVPVYNTNTGDDLRTDPDLTTTLITQICTLPVHWERATTPSPLPTHILDFGPGGTSGIGALTQRNKEGRGVQVVLAATLVEGDGDMEREGGLLDQSFVFDANEGSV
ncbi:beta subunit of fatty acid synthetase, partial [Borealophlyctis nickersoniae]